jgi:hypothetical protein
VDVDDYAQRIAGVVVLEDVRTARARRSLPRRERSAVLARSYRASWSRMPSVSSPSGESSPRSLSEPSRVPCLALRGFYPDSMRSGGPRNEVVAGRGGTPLVMPVQRVWGAAEIYSSSCVEEVFYEVGGIKGAGALHQAAPAQERWLPLRCCWLTLALTKRAAAEGPAHQLRRPSAPG